MIRLFIIDDEMIIRQGLQHAINWEAHGVIVCGAAANGRAALRSMAESKPDVVITDIQMPQLDGFSFFDKVRELLPRIRVIVLTGYGSAEYMLKALRLGAFDYLEKPADSQTILETVLRAKAQIELEQEDARRLRHGEYLLSRTENLMRAWLIQNLLQEGLEDQYVLELGEALGLPLSQGQRYHLMLMRPQESGIWPLLTALSKAFGTLNVRHLMGLGLVGGFLPGTLSREEIARTLSGIEGLSGLCASQIAVCMEVLPIEEGAEAYSRIVRELDRSYLFEAGQLQILETGEEGMEEEAADYAAFLRACDRVLRLADKGEAEEALSCVTAALNALARAGVECEQFYRLSQQLLMTAAHVLRRDDLLQDIANFCASQPTLARVKEQAAALLRGEYESAPAENALVEQALAYMREHYAERLSVGRVAAHLYLSAGYFGRLFKKALGRSFSAALMDIRLQEAKRLLRQTDRKYYDIAVSVGFSSYKQFASQFQHFTGLSAGEYRTLNRGVGDVGHT